MSHTSPGMRWQNSAWGNVKAAFTHLSLSRPGQGAQLVFSVPVKFHSSAVRIERINVKKINTGILMFGTGPR